MLPFPSAMMLNGAAEVEVTGGALVSRGATAFSSTSGAAVSWATEEYDRTSWFDTVSPTRITVPAGVALVRPLAAINGNSNSQSFRFTKNGASYAGEAKDYSGLTGSPGYNVIGAPVAVSPGDYFELVKDDTSTTAPDADGNWFALEQLPASLRYCLLTKTSSQPIGAGVNAAITWATEVADVGGWFDAGLSTTRVTVPAGVSRVRVTACVRNNGSTAGQLNVQIWKGGASTTRGYARKDEEFTGQKFICVSTAILEVTPGDYFELYVQGTNAETVPAHNGVWLCIEEASSTVRALAYKATNQPLSASTLTAISYDGEVYDTSSLHSTVSNTSRMTVPAGMTQARISYGTAIDQSSGMVTWAGKNGLGRFAGAPSRTNATFTFDHCNGLGAWVDVVEGDYFEVFVFAGAATITDQDAQWFCMECR